MGRAARELALRHTIEQNFAQVFAIYEEIIAQKIGLHAEPTAAARPAPATPLRKAA